MQKTVKNSQNNRVGDFIKSPTKDYLRNLDCSRFFPKYAPMVKSWKCKLRGYSSKKKPLNFTLEDYKNILSGIKKMQTEIFISTLENEN